MKIAIDCRYMGKSGIGRVCQGILDHLDYDRHEYYLIGVPEKLQGYAAKEIVEELSDEDVTAKVSEIAVRERSEKKRPKVKKYDEVDIAQMSLFDTVKDDDVLEELKNLDVGNMTPIDALNTIYRLQNKLKNRW